MPGQKPSGRRNNESGLPYVVVRLGLGRARPSAKPPRAKGRGAKPIRAYGVSAYPTYPLSARTGTSPGGAADWIRRPL